MPLCPISLTTHAGEKPLRPMEADLTPKQRRLWKVIGIVSVIAAAVLFLAGCTVLGMGMSAYNGIYNSGAILQMAAGVMMLCMGLPQLVVIALKCWKKNKAQGGEEHLKAKTKVMADALKAAQAALKAESQAKKAAEAAKANEINKVYEDLRAVKVRAELILAKLPDLG